MQVPEFWQGEVIHTLSNWQVSPWNPLTQEQLKSFWIFSQTPEFSQGLLKQASVNSQFVP